MEQKFPKLYDNQVAVLRAEYLTGVVLDKNFDVYKKTIGGEIYTKFDSFNLAQKYIEEYKEIFKNVEFVIYDSNQKVICYIQL